TLEEETQRKLQVSFVALSGHLPESGTRRIEVRSVPIGVIERIEGLRAELEPGFLVQSELLIETDVPVLEARAVNAADSRLENEGSGRRLGENGGAVGPGYGEPLGRILRASGGKLLRVGDVAVDRPELAGGAAIPVTVLPHTGIVVVTDH